MRKWTTILVVSAALVTAFIPVCAAQTPALSLKAFSIEGIGTSVFPAELVGEAAVGTETMTNLETQYDLTSSGKSGSHYARLVVYKDSRDLGFAGTLLDLVDFKPELVAMMSNMGKNLVSQKMEEHGLKLLEWAPVTKITVQKHNGIHLGAKFSLSDKLPLPMFASVAVYPQDGKLTGLALICPDSDKAYWQPVFTQLVQNLK